MDLIAIGRISKPIGARGEAKISPLTYSEERFAALSDVWIGHEPEHVTLKRILKARIDARRIVVTFEGIETVEDAERLRDAYLFVAQKDSVHPQNGTYFIDDVIGCEVVTEEQTYVGRISNLFSLPMNDVWIIQKGSQEIFIPAVKDIIRQVDVENKRITIHALDGLLE
jgi:16S rRNA processing protein RimM